MDWDRVIYNGTVVNDDGMQRADIYIRDGRVAAVTSERLPGTVGETTDASGRYILPGLIETHVHSRDGRLATGEKEDFRSSTAAAAATGITTVFEMPNCTPTIHSAESLCDLVSVIQPKAHADFCVWGLALGDANLASLPALAEAGCVAFKFFWGYAVDRRDNSLIYNYREGMDNVLPPPDDGQIYRLFRAVKATGKRLGIHAENFSIVRALTQEALAAGAQDYAALLRTRPVSCETSIIDTAIDMAKELSMPLHVLHVGVGDGVEHLRRAKAFCRLRHKVADRPRTEHRNVHAGHVAHLPHGVHRHRKRLQHRALFKAHAFRDWCHFLCVHRKKFGCRARRLEAHDFQLLAQVVLAVPARIALAAVHLRLNRHFLPDGKPFDIRTALYNFARDLMPLRHGVFRERMLAVVHVDVRAANADVHNFHQHLPVPDFRHGNFPENDLARLCHNLLKHTLSSQLL